MEMITFTREEFKEWCEKYMHTYTDWTGTRVETYDRCESIDEFVDLLFRTI